MASESSKKQLNGICDHFKPPGILFLIEIKSSINFRFYLMCEQGLIIRGQSWRVWDAPLFGPPTIFIDKNKAFVDNNPKKRALLRRKV